MGLLTGLLTLPLAPVRGTIWVAEQLAAQAARELDDEGAIRRKLLEAEVAYEAGQIDEVEYDALEDELLARLEAIRESNKQPEVA